MRSSADWSSAIVHLCKASSGPFSPSLPPTHSVSQFVHGNAVNGRENNKLHSFQGIIITSITEQFHSQRVDDDETTTHYQRRRRPGWQQKNRRMCRIELLFHYWEFPNHLRVMCAERGAREEETLPASQWARPGPFIMYVQETGVGAPARITTKPIPPTCEGEGTAVELFVFDETLISPTWWWCFLLPVRPLVVNERCHEIEDRGSHNTDRPRVLIIIVSVVYWSSRSTRSLSISGRGGKSLLISK